MWVVLRIENVNIAKDFIDVSGVVTNVKKSLKENMPQSLAHCDSSHLIVFDGEAALIAGKACSSDIDISCLRNGQLEDNPVIVTAPSLQPNLSYSQSSASIPSVFSPTNSARLSSGSLSAAYLSPGRGGGSPITQPPPPASFYDTSLNNLSDLSSNQPAQSQSLPPLQPFTMECLEDPDYLCEELKRYFGYDSFRDGQFELIMSVLCNKDALGVMATGQGKSLTFQLPALVSGKVSICISPLISLMQDQVIKLNESVGKIYRPHNPEIACFLGTGQEGKEAAARKGDFLFIYITPEKLSANGMSIIENLSSTVGLSSICIDEAHTVSEWGHDFRPEFQLIGDILRGQGHASSSSLRHVPIIALTATAPPVVQKDIVSSLHLNQGFYQFTGSFLRKNLQFEVRPKHGQGYEKDLQFFVKEVMKSPSYYSKPTIIYCNTRAHVEFIRDFLTRSVGTKTHVLMYHGSLSPSERQANHRAFLTGSIGNMSGLGSGNKNAMTTASIIVATLAFGMGIDKPDVRNVIHWGAPRTVEAYYQQAGRAGRDGAPSRCILIYSTNEFMTFKTADFYKPKSPNGVVNQKQLHALNLSTDALQAFCESSQCRQVTLITYLLGSTRSAATKKCNCCDQCLAMVKREQGFKGSDFTEEVLCILNMVEEFPGKTMGTLVSLLMGLEQSKVASLLKSRKQKELYGSFKVGNRLSSKNKTVAQSFVEHLKTAKLFVSETNSFTNPGGFKVHFETLSLSSVGRQLLQSLRNYRRSSSNSSANSRSSQATTTNDPFIAKYCSFQPPLPLTELIEERNKRIEALRTEIGTLPTMSGVFIPPAELLAGEGPILEAELKWGRFLQFFVTKRERAVEAGDSSGADEAKSKLEAAEALIELLNYWRSSEGARLSLAPGSILPEVLLKKVAYAATHGSVLASLLEGIGIRVGNKEDLAMKLHQWRSQLWGVGDENISKNDMKLTIVNEWQSLNYGQPCASGKALKDAQVESLNLFLKGNSIEEVALKKAKQVVPSTVEGHLLDALLSGAPSLLKSQTAMNRLFEQFPSMDECQQIEAAYEAAGDEISWQDLKSPLKPLCEALGGDGSWYSKIRAFRVLKHLKYPFDAVYAKTKSMAPKQGQKTMPPKGPPSKRVKTEK